MEATPKAPNFLDPVSFTLSGVTGEISGETFAGTFKAKKTLSHREQLAQEDLYRQYLGRNWQVPDPKVLKEDLPEEARNTMLRATVFSTLAVYLVEAPPWWIAMGNGMDCVDEAPVTAVYAEVIKIRAAFLKDLDTRKAKAQETLKTTTVAPK